MIIRDEEITKIAPFFSQIAAFRGSSLNGISLEAEKMLTQKEALEIDPTLSQPPNHSSLQLTFSFSNNQPLRERFLKVRRQLLSNCISYVIIGG